MELDFIKFKKFCYTEEYKKYNKILINIQNHINDLYIINIINIEERNTYINNTLEIINNINNINNNNINKDNNKILIYNKYREDISYNNEILYYYLLMIDKLPIRIKKKHYNDYILIYDIICPLKNINKYIINILYNVGYCNIIDILYLFKLEYLILNKIEQEILNLYNDVYVPIKIKILNNYIYNNEELNEIINNTEFFTKKIYIKINEESFNEELLENNYILYININKIWIKIYGYFKLNILQLNDKIIKKKIIINNLISENNLFKKKYLKNSSINEIITMSIDTYLCFLDNKYNKYKEINNKSFLYLMKDFIGNNLNLINWFNIIKLLLLGTEDNIKIAGSLFTLLKEKKKDLILIPNIIYNNLCFNSQIKLKKINITLKKELDILNELSYESLDLKKELTIMSQIPLYVRLLTIEKINEMKLNNNDYNKQLLYVNTILHFPWLSDNNNHFNLLNNNSATNFIIDTTNKLDEKIYGHKKVKEQIILLITKWITNPNSSGTAIGIYGPPGVGKTMIVKSLSEVLNIPMVMITLGGQNDSELLIGHGYTYSGSQPGIIIRKMCEIGKSKCIIYFDELDKSCSKYGTINEITSILIHLTDTNTNKNFQDRFFQGIDFPLDKVIFITSYNDRDKIDPILLDRFIELDIKPYSIDDKINILKDYIIPELKNNIGFNKNIEINNNVVKRFIYEYTAEAGVRDLKHKMEQIILNINKNNIFKKYTEEKIIITDEIILKYLGIHNKIEHKLIYNENNIGSINVLYARSNSYGGINTIQISPILCGEKFQLKITGMIGEIMKESIYIAFTNACNYIINNFDKYNIDNIDLFLKNNFAYGFHVNITDSSISKDGSSAGIGFTVCFISVILKKYTNRLISMTGEIDLFYNILKVGGLILKIYAAKYSNSNTILIPYENKNDVEDIILNSSNIFDENFKYIYIKNLNDVVKYTLL